MNKYEVIGLIGEGIFHTGAYGIVIKAKNKETGEIVAIKKFKELEDDENVRKTIIREVKILKQLKNENIVQLKEAFRRKGRLYLVFEYIDKNLLEIIEENSNGLDVKLMQPHKIKSFIYQLCKAINFCHSQNIIHRDIKPENLLISLSGSLRLCDFGFARTLSPIDVLTEYVATRWYRAPELLVGSPYDTSIDMWAIGCMMAELIDSQPLFPGESDIDQIYCIQKSLGPLIPSHMEYFSHNKNYSGLKLPKIKTVERIDTKYEGKIDRVAIKFIEDLVQMDPKKRLTSAEALQHPYFENFFIDKRPQTSNNIERGRSALSSHYYYKNKNMFPSNPSPTHVYSKKSQKVYGSIPPEKKKIYDKEKFKIIKKNLTEGEKNDISTVFRTTSNGTSKDTMFNIVEEKFKYNKTRNHDTKHKIYENKDLSVKNYFCDNP